MYCPASGRGPLWLCVFLVSIAIARIVATYPILTHTMDEPTHIAVGLEWWQEHRYTYETIHPPLGRIAAAAGPYLLGAKNVAHLEVATKSPLLLYNAHSYWTMLGAARVGELPFFILGATIVWLWARRLHGTATAVCAVFLFTTLPPVLAHAGLATTDMALCSTVVAATYALFLWLETPDSRRALVLGAAVAAALLSKFTALVYLPACFAVTLLVHPRRPGVSSRATAKALPVAVLGTFALLWAGYWFSVAEVPLVKGVYMLPIPEPVKALSLNYPTLHLPAGEYARGILEAQFYNQFGHWSYLLGRQSNTGWWYFFPVVFAIKTPLPFIGLLVAGCYLIRRAPREHRLPAACALAIFFVVLPARINLGIRHILPVYPLLAIPAGYALATMLAAPRGTIRVIAAGLALWSAGASIAAHPDYIGYFNEIAADAPEQYRVDSDLDWGQNLKRLSEWVHERGIRDPISFGAYGASDPSRHDILCRPASPWQPATGWVAVSTTPLMMARGQAPDGSNRRPWWWLDGRTPVDSVGGILLFHIAPNEITIRAADVK